MKSGQEPIFSLKSFKRFIYFKINPHFQKCTLSTAGYKFMQLTDVKAQSVEKQGHASGTCGTHELRNMSVSTAVRIKV